MDRPAERVFKGRSGRTRELGPPLAICSSVGAQRPSSCLSPPISRIRMFLLHRQKAFILEFREGPRHRPSFRPKGRADPPRVIRRWNSAAENPRAMKRWDMLSRKAASRSSARIDPSSIITPWSRTISRLITCGTGAGGIRLPATALPGGQTGSRRPSLSPSAVALQE